MGKGILPLPKTNLGRGAAYITVVIIIIVRFSAFSTPLAANNLQSPAAGWHLPHWRCDVIGPSSLWPTRRCEDVLSAFSFYFTVPFLK